MPPAAIAFYTLNIWKPKRVDDTPFISIQSDEQRRLFPTPLWQAPAINFNLSDPQSVPQNVTKTTKI